MPKNKKIRICTLNTAKKIEKELTTYDQLSNVLMAKQYY